MGDLPFDSDASALPSSQIVRRRLAVHGRVQGVGFRPFAYRLATQLRLAGLVGNDSHGAFIELEGSAAAIEQFTQRLRAELPPIARISSIAVESIPSRGESAFRIETSANDGTQDAEITPDVALCADCRRELFDPADRRFGYPFINCTNCGPRYSIIRSVPYDRPGTTMARFIMCPACQAEYDDPGSRRFHAQPNACPVCGPRVWMEENDAATRGHGDAVNQSPTHERGTDADSIRRCAELLKAGKIVAIKGLGGFHLACRADDDEVVATLRSRKSRESKPLGLMVADVAMARELAEIDDAAAAALKDVIRPIVLVPRRLLESDRTSVSVQCPGQACPERSDGAGGVVSKYVAPGTDMLGLMLPYTPLHELLFAEGLGPLVMTSGNPSDEPLCSDNDEALERLSHIADAFLLHDRDIERRVDDSVVMVSAERGAWGAGGEPRGLSPRIVGEEGDAGRGEDRTFSIVPIRRARGFAPSPIRVPLRADVPVLAVGAELKSTVCVLAGDTAIVSEHLGELANAKAYRNFVATVEQFQKLLRVKLGAIAFDLHPDYNSTRFAQQYAREHDLPSIGVQHHHAHMVSAMAENGLTGRAIAVVADGTGYGTDGAIWGCEVLVGDETDFERAGHLRYFKLLGGDAAAKETWRPAAGLLHDCYGEDWRAIGRPMLQRVSEEALSVAHTRLAQGRLVHTSSLGRLFDAVAFLLGTSDENGHEAAAAMALEALARTAPRVEPLTFSLENPQDGDAGPLRLDTRPIARAVVEGMAAGRDAAVLARAFHETIAAGLADMVVRTAERTGVERVVLSGGCFANRLLLASLSQRLQSAGLAVYAHRLVPTGDGGVSLGQAVCAANVGCCPR